MSRTRPNILWLMTDEQRCDSLGCYGSPWARTPHIDRLAGEGVLFETAITPAPVCMPARTSLLAGQYPSQTGVWHNDHAVKSASASLMPAFRDAGYQTASFGKQHYAPSADGSGAFGIESGPCLSDHVDYFNYAGQYDESRHGVLKYPEEIYPWIFGGKFPAPAEETAEARVVDQALRWLDEREGEDPFFLRCSFNGPHTPVAPPAPFDELIPPACITLPADAESRPEGCPDWVTQELARCASSDPMSAQQVQRMRQCYYGEVAYLDTQFGRLLDHMKRQGHLDNCIVVYLSDHGTHLGDYGLVQKQTFFEPVINVPFIFWAPHRISSGLRYRIPVGIQSLLPTLLELAGIGPAASGCAASLATSLEHDREPESGPVFSELNLQSFAPHIRHQGRLVMVRHEDWKLSVCLDPKVHDAALYDLKSDPHERNNRATDPLCQDRYGALLQLIVDHIG